MTNPNHLMIFWYGWGESVTGYEIKAQNFFLIEPSSNSQNIIGIDLIFTYKNVGPIDMALSQKNNSLFVLDSNGNLLI